MQLVDFKMTKGLKLKKSDDKHWYHAANRPKLKYFTVVGSLKAIWVKSQNQYKIHIFQHSIVSMQLPHKSQFNLKDSWS